ncbi:MULTISPECIES: hypothetical protein [unclassified Streptomyces]|uniref:hypothetical protein n=1 Tax=Streptomyces TaxID=1883 RepID=UPI000DC79929|nr:MULTISPECIES: hypothetical protein [unclassified Streptomyces]AWZ06916.1 hypothetical protein DRB89_22400 [Streptomyces sp. ICC4]AWZ14581.1 hypothetical protein DRB96_22550 [Streptomyces sp. ICC1]
MSAAAVALLFGGAGILLAASPAQAADVSYKVECVPPAGGGGPVQGTTTASVTAPATAKVGDEVEVVWKTVKPASNNTDIMDLAKDSIKPIGYAKVGGAQSGELKMEGTRTNPPIPKKAPMVISDMKAKLKLTKAGDVTISPGKYDVDWSGLLTHCTPQEAVGVGVTIKVTEGGGGTPGGSTTGTPGGGGQTDFPGKAVEVAFDCGAFLPGGIKSPVTINAKKNGGNYDLTVKTAKGAMKSPAALPAGALKPSMNIKIGGGDSGTVKVSGPATTTAIGAGDPVTLSDMTGTYKPGKTGKATLSPDTMTIDVVMAPGATPIVVPCTATSTGVSLELDTTAQAGGAAGSPGATGNTSSGNLAETGAEDEGGIKALALVAGTVMLLGAAVFTFTPWRRLRGHR